MRQRATLYTLAILALLSLSVLAASAGVAYAKPSSSNDNGDHNVQLEITSLSKQSGPSYTSLTFSPTLPAGSVNVNVGPFAPGNTVGISITVKNIGNTPATSLPSSLTITTGSNAFVASQGSVPHTLPAGHSFTTTLTIQMKSGLGNPFQGSTAHITFTITSQHGEE